MKIRLRQKIIKILLQRIIDLQSELDKQIALNKKTSWRKSCHSRKRKPWVSEHEGVWSKVDRRSFLSGFKGYEIELEGKRLQMIKDEFDRDTKVGDWGEDYESQNR